MQTLYVFMRAFSTLSTAHCQADCALCMLLQDTATANGGSPLPNGNQLTVSIWLAKKHFALFMSAALAGLFHCKL